MKNLLTMAALACAITLALNTSAGAHGFEGDRFFPPTPLTDDPFAVDELSLPEVQYNPAQAARELDVTGSFSPTSITGSGTSDFTLTVARNAPTGTFPITITGTGGGVTKSTTLTFSVER